MLRSSCRVDAIVGERVLAPDSERDAALIDRAYRLLARRDRSRAEMQNYLQRYCDDATIVARLLDDLQSRGYLCEARLAEQVIRARRPRASASRVRQELARRGIAGEVIADSTVGLEASDLQAALALWRKRFRAPATDRAQRERQLRYLLNRGFNHAIALKVLRAIGDDDEFDPGQ